MIGTEALSTAVCQKKTREIAFKELTGYYSRLFFRLSRESALTIEAVAHDPSNEPSQTLFTFGKETKVIEAVNFFQQN